MGDKIAVINEKVYSFEGVFDLKETYKFMIDYIDNYMYYDLTEKEYEEKFSGPAKTIISNIQGEKILNDSYSIIIKGKIELSGKDSEVEINGVKKIMTTGKGKITLNSYLDPKKDADPTKNPWAAFLNKIYDKFVGIDELDKACAVAAKDIHEIITKFKIHMNSITK